MLDAMPDILRGNATAPCWRPASAAFRRSELVALQAADLAFEPDGLLVQIRRSKTDPDGQGQEIAITQDTKLHPVRAVPAWMQVARIADGKLFRSIDRHGRIGAALTAQSWH